MTRPETITITEAELERTVRRLVTCYASCGMWYIYVGEQPAGQERNRGFARLSVTAIRCAIVAAIKQPKRKRQ